MLTFLAVLIVVMLTLGVLSYLKGQHADQGREQANMYSLLPGDIKYESPSGNFRFYFPITTSIVISLVLSLVLWLMS